VTGCDLGEEGLVCAVIQQNDSDVLVALLGGDVQRSAQIFAGGVRLSAVLQQQSHVVHVAQPCRDVQGRLLLLITSIHTRI